MTDLITDIRAECEQWKSIADMLAFTLWDKIGADHQACDPSACAVAFSLARHAEAAL